MQCRFLGLAIICLVTLGITASAHHSHNAYEVTKWSPLEGMVKEVHLVVPHSWIYLDVRDGKGETTTWALEAAGPSDHERMASSAKTSRSATRSRCGAICSGTAPTAAFSASSLLTTVTWRAATASSESGTSLDRIN